MTRKWPRINRGARIFFGKVGADGRKGDTCDSRTPRAAARLTCGSPAPAAIQVLRRQARRNAAGPDTASLCLGTKPVAERIPYRPAGPFRKIRGSQTLGVFGFDRTAQGRRKDHRWNGARTCTFNRHGERRSLRSRRPILLLRSSAAVEKPLRPSRAAGTFAHGKPLPPPARFRCRKAHGCSLWRSFGHMTAGPSAVERRNLRPTNFDHATAR